MRRGKLDMTQTELASLLGLSVRFISDCENREGQIPKWLGVCVQAMASVQPTPK